VGTGIESLCLGVVAEATADAAAKTATIITTAAGSIQRNGERDLPSLVLFDEDAPKARPLVSEFE